MPVEVNGVQGAKARAELLSMRTGEIVGGAEAYCMRDEEKWNTRPKYEGRGDNRKKVGDEPVPWYQLASMAQTRAGAKALRNRLSWVVVLAGYKTTPAEEMPDTEVVAQDKAAVPVEHWCAQHKVNYFKSGKMRGYAHKIAGTDTWCNEPEDVTATPDATAPVVAAPVVAEQPTTQEQAAGNSHRAALIAFVQHNRPSLRTEKNVLDFLCSGPHPYLMADVNDHADVVMAEVQKNNPKWA